MFLAELMDSTIVRLVGLVVVLRLVLSVYHSLFDLIRTTFFPWDYKRKFGDWAIVTGCTDGIGQELSRELARRGVNIVLISRSEEKLDRAAKEIENEFKVKTLVVQADFTDKNCYKKIEDSIQDIDVGILVNNVGMATTVAKNYTRFSQDELWNELNVNCGAAMIMTHIILPRMKKNRRGLIVNNASLSALIGLPGAGIYSSTKSFIVMFSYNIQEEVKRYNITVRCLVPGAVLTKMADIIKPLLDKLKQKHLLLSYIAPDAKTFARWTIKSLASDSIVLSGYWGHSLTLAVISILPLKYRVKITGFLMGTKPKNN